MSIEYVKVTASTFDRLLDEIELRLNDKHEEWELTPFRPNQYWGRWGVTHSIWMIRKHK